MSDVNEFNAEPLFWMILVALGFVMGALNGLVLLVLRHWRYQEAGNRWAVGFWIAMLWAPIAFAISRIPLNWWGETLTTMTSSHLYFLISFWLILNSLGVWRIGRWAARE